VTSRDASPWDLFHKDCPTRQVIDLIGDRWTVLVILALNDGPQRFSCLTERVQGITEKMLTQTLRDLERDGLVQRIVYPAVPPHVEYSLTPEGQTLTVPIEAIESWAYRHIEQILAARKEFDERGPSQMGDRGKNWWRK
jgi:DNA-binding HxlR family transcriptional regulator